MYALGPKQIGAKLNLDNVQFFVDYCNVSIINGDAHTSVILPNFRAIALSMEIEMVRDGVEEIKKIELNQEERNHVEKVFGDARWFTLFTTRSLLEDFIPLANDETVEIIRSIISRIDYKYNGPIFILSTVRLGTPEESTVPKVGDVVALTSTATQTEQPAG